MERSPDSDGSLLDSDEALERSREVLGSPLHEKSMGRFSFFFLLFSLFKIRLLE